MRSRERPKGASGSTEVAARAANEVNEQDRLPAVTVLGGTRRGSREDEDARRKDRRERVKRATEDHSERIESSRLGLWRCPPSICWQLFISDRLGGLAVSCPRGIDEFVRKSLTPKPAN
ncbi:hypothetical protein GCM10009060_01090 [Halorubrum trapanicum]